MQKAYRTPNVQDQKRNTPRHIIIKMLNIQNYERILKAAKEKRLVTFKDTNSNCKTVMERHFSGPEQYNCQPRLNFQEKLSFLTEGEIKTFHNNQKLKELITTKPALQKILKGLLHTEEIRVRSKYASRNKPF
jgi:hypothetical protein